jgi:hypothetical protein
MTDIIKINDNLFVDAEDFYEKICVPRNIKTYNEDPNEEIIEEEV